MLGLLTSLSVKEFKEVLDNPFCVGYIAADRVEPIQIDGLRFFPTYEEAQRRRDAYLESHKRDRGQVQVYEFNFVVHPLQHQDVRDFKKE